MRLPWLLTRSPIIVGPGFCIIGVARIAEYGGAWARVGWLAAFFYAVAAALRLARFNTRVGSTDKRFFEGLPSPSAAALVSGFIWASTEWREPGLAGLVVAFTVTALAGALMVSSFSFPSFKNFDLRKPVRFVWLVMAVLAFVVVAGDPSDPKSGYFAAGAPEQGAKWKTANGDFTGTVDKNGLDTDVKTGAHDDLHAKVDKDKSATVDWNHDG